MYKLGFSTIGCPDYTVDQIIGLARQTGLLGVELRFVNGSIDLASQPEFSENVGETRRKFENAGIKVVAVDSSARLGSLDATTGAVQMAAGRESLALASDLGATFVRVFGGAASQLTGGERELDIIARDLNTLAVEGRELGVKVIIETHDIFSTSESLIDLYDRAAGDDLGVLWDTLHTVRHGESPQATWSAIGHRIDHVHVKDASTATLEGFELALTGEGITPVDEILGVLDEAAYGGYVNFEWEKGWRRHLAEPEIAIPHFAAFMAQR